jgi:micrococcal nuclease
MVTGPARRVVIPFALALAILGSAWPAVACLTPGKPAGLAPATVEHVSDGDTVRLRFPSGRRERTRLIGLDAPEAHANEKLERDVARTGRDRATILAFGRQASAFARRLLPEGATVAVEHDLQARDRRGRLLAYLWTPEGAMVNLVILREGYAQVLTVRPNLKYQAVLLRCQREAREAGRGLWGRLTVLDGLPERLAMSAVRA